MPSTLVVGAVGLSEGEARSKFINSDRDTFVQSGVIIYFMDAGSNLRIRNGKLEVRNDSTNAWHPFMVDNVDGIATPYLGDPVS